MKRTRLLSVLALVLVIGLVAVACGDDDGGATTTAAATTLAVDGNVLILGNGTLAKHIGHGEGDVVLSVVVLVDRILKVRCLSIPKFPIPCSRRSRGEVGKLDSQDFITGGGIAAEVSNRWREIRPQVQFGDGT